MSRAAITRRVALIGGGLLLLAGARAEAAAGFAAVLHDGASERVIGTVALDAKARMKVIAADPAHRKFLRRLARRMNGKDIMHVDAPPPTGSPRYTTASRVIRRGEPDFVPALMDYLRTYYNLELRQQ